MRRIVFTLALAIGPLPARAGDVPGAVVQGIVVVEGEPPTPKKWDLDKGIQRLTGDKSYSEETWLVGKNKGLAHCVVTLKAKNPAKRIAPKPLEKAVLEKVGVRYVPRVLVVTADTQVVFRNKESPCRGFMVSGNPRLGNDINELILEGTERKRPFKGPDICSVSCSVRPYARGYIHVVDTPHYAVTDARGRFTMRKVPQGQYQVMVWHEAAGKLTKEAGPVELSVAGNGNHELNFKVKIPGNGRK